MKVLWHDYETFCEGDLPSIGVSEYARDPSLEIILGSWSLNDGETVKQYDRFADGDRLPNEFLDALEDDRIVKAAWNFPFEWNITKHALGIDVAPEDALDPMVLARALSLPGSLSEACRILNMPETEWKHGGGRALINYFCKPRKPTKRNPSLRNTDQANPEKWGSFKAYNRQDIRAMVAAWFRMKRWNMPDFEWRLWEYDRKINEAGVPVNLRAIDNANRIVDALTSKSAEDLTRVTGLDNANSGQQLLGWLRERDYPFNDMKIGHVRRALADARTDGDGDTNYAVALLRRTETSKASLKKFTAYDKMANDDGLLRNMLQFNGAGRTCRWSGSGVQVHNMARPHWFFEKAEMQERLARHIARCHPHLFEWLYSRADPKSPTGRLLVDPFEAMSSGVRGVIAAPDGYVFVSADFNAIENRVLGYMADEERILNVFKEGRDPYVDFAVYMFGGTYDELWHEYKVLGQKTKRTTAKPGVLGCFGANTLVLTGRGWVRIVDVRADDLVHDGTELVAHAGVVDQGPRETLYMSGIHVTPDHEFLINAEWIPACRLESQPHLFRQALSTARGLLSLAWRPRVAGGPRTCVSAPAASEGTYPGRTSSADCPPDAPDAPADLDEAMSGNASGRPRTIYLPIDFTPSDPVARTRSLANSHTTEVEESSAVSETRTSLFDTWSKRWDSIRRSKLIVGITTVTTNVGTYARRIGLCRTATATTVIASGIAGGGTPPPSSVVCSRRRTETTLPSLEKPEPGCRPNKSSTTRPNAKARTTYDIRNAGPRNRFVIWSEAGPLIAHNCGYMLGEGFEYEDEATGEILATGLLGYARGMGITDFTAEQSARSVKVWRETYSKVSDYDDGLWYALDRAVRKTISTGRRTEVNMFEFDKDGPFLTARLPSGRKLYYLRPRLEDRKTPWGEIRPTVTYEGIDSRSTRKVWGRISTHPGKTTENLDQALARDCLAHALMRLHDRNVVVLRTRRGGPVVDVRLHVHDEIVALAREDEAEEVAKILSEAMSEPMDWAPGLPLKAVADISKVFVKT